RDFRVGVVLAIVLMPIAGSSLFPHAMFGITGLNPLNMLLRATLASFLLYGLFAARLRHFVPRPLLLLYIAPIVIAGIMGSRHVGEVLAGILGCRHWVEMLPGFFRASIIGFHEPVGYLIELLAKPMMLVLFALLV